MYTLFSTIIPLYPLFALVNAIPTDSGVKLDDGWFSGRSNGQVVEYLGIPYAQPPVGPLRLQRPQPVQPYQGRYDASEFGHSCLQQVPHISHNSTSRKLLDHIWESSFNYLWPDDEDFWFWEGLTLNIVVPASLDPDYKLPVLVWIYGGAFTMGTTKQYKGDAVVSRSMSIGQPVIYVSINYRLGILGFLGGKEVKEAGVGNLGFFDQRLALEWVKKNIPAFGGDPSKVTLWGESAGAISVAMHMVVSWGDPEVLFRGAFMQSGAVIPLGDMTDGQETYNGVVEALGCLNATDTLECIRGAPYSLIKQTADDTAETFLPRVDGDFLKRNPYEALREGKITPIPFVSGVVDDEGTVFALRDFGPSTDQEFVEWLRGRYLRKAAEEEIIRAMELYPSDPTVGSPYDTGLAYALTPQFKRMASLGGDLVFQAPRRYLLEQTAGKQKAWTYLIKKGKWYHLGAYHTSDIPLVFGESELLDYLIQFAVHLDPNGDGPSPHLIHWPEWTKERKEMLVIDDHDSQSLTVSHDTFREKAIGFLGEMCSKYPQ